MPIVNVVIQFNVILYIWKLKLNLRSYIFAKLAHDQWQQDCIYWLLRVFCVLGQTHYWTRTRHNKPYFSMHILQRSRFLVQCYFLELLFSFLFRTTHINAPITCNQYIRWYSANSTAVSLYCCQGCGRIYCNIFFKNLGEQ